jgi:RNA polymerase sigma factor for flagellar operon FliA
MADTPKAAATPHQYPHSPDDLRQEPSYPMWVRLRSGDRATRNELALKYTPLVKYVMGRMAISLPVAMDWDDVLAAGTVGLLQAIDRYDPGQGVRFETYALQRIRGAIIDSIRSLSPLPRTASARVRRLDETTAALAHRLGRTPTSRELASELGVNQAQLARTLFESAHAIVSLDRGPSAGGDDGEIISFCELLHDSEATTEESVDEIELLERLADAVNALPPRDRLVLNLYYSDLLTLKEIARIIDVSESRVSQVHASAIRKLRRDLGVQQPACIAA